MCLFALQLNKQPKLRDDFTRLSQKKKFRFVYVRALVSMPTFLQHSLWFIPGGL